MVPLVRFVCWKYEAFAAGSFVGSHDLGYYVEDIDGGEEAPLPLACAVPRPVPSPCLRRPRGP